MRITKVNNNILKISNNGNIQYLACRDVDKLRKDKDYFNSVIRRHLQEIKAKYILMASKSFYEYIFLLYNDREKFIKACCEPLSLRLNRDDLLKIE